MSAESPEAQLVAQLGKSFPSLSGPQGAQRVETLGLYTAKAWAAGATKLHERGVLVPTPIHAALVATAAKVKQARRGGTTFLCHLRRGMADDAKYVAVIRALATLYAKAASGRHKTLAQANQDLSLSQSGEHFGLSQSDEGHPSPVAASSQAVASLGPGSLVAGYEILEQIGEGGMGRVFKARQESLDRDVALKILNPSLADDDPTFMERLKEEAKAGAKLAHQNVVGVIDQGRCPRSGIQYVAFEFVDGVTAKSLLAQRPGGVMPEGEALNLGLAVAEALVCAESHGMIHRDVKPENILIGKDGVPKLADLGLAKRKREREDDSQPEAGMIVGTPQFMAPEQALGVDECDIRADLFSLGITIFRLVTGRFPYESESVIGIITLQMTNDVPDPRSFNPKITAGSAQVISGLCARERDERYPTARSAVLDLQRVLSAKPPLGPREAGIQTSQTRRRSTGGIQVRASGGFATLEAVEVSDAPPALDEPSQAIWRYEQSGNPTYLEDALRLYKQVATSSAPALAAMGTAGQGRVFLLQGNLPRAEELARFAFQSDPECQLALEVVADVERLGQQALYGVGLTRMSALIAANRDEAAKAVAAQIARDYPKEPHHHLAMAVLANRAGDEAGHLRSLQLAWALYPSTASPAQPLGHSLDVACVEVLVNYGRGALLSNNPQIMAHSVQKIDHKNNLFAGALQMAIGMSYVALTCAPCSPLERNRFLLLIARALTGLQFFDAAKTWLGRVGRFPPNATRESTHLEQEKGRIQRYLASKNSAIKPQPGAYASPTANLIRGRVERRRRVIAKRCKQHEEELVQIKANIGQMADDNQAVKEEIQIAANSAALDDPFAQLDALRDELEGVERELNEVGQEADAGGGGLFAMIKGAAKKAGDLAKQGQLKLKISQLKSKIATAGEIPGEQVVDKLSAHDYSASLLKHVRRARHLLASLDYHHAEDHELSAQLELVNKLIG